MWYTTLSPKEAKEFKKKEEKSKKDLLSTAKKTSYRTY